MNNIMFSNTSMPIINGCDLLIASNPFLHLNRVLDFHVMIYVLEGAIHVTEDDIDYSIKPGELFFLKKGLHHYGKTEIPKGTKWHFVHFYFAEDNDASLFSMGYSQIDPNTPVRFCSVLPKKLTGLRGSFLETQIEEFTKYYQSNNVNKAWDINTRLWLLLSEIAGYETSNIDNLSLPDKICDYLNKHSCEQFSAKKIEQHFFLSYKHMASVFKNEKKITMQQYHNSLKMNEAARLLRSTLLSVSEVGEKVGFSDVLYFSRCFNSFHGASPTSYRKHCKYEY